MYDIKQPESIRKEYQTVELLEKVADYIQVCESDIDSYYHWSYLKKMYLILTDIPVLKDKYKDILTVLEPFILKHSGNANNSLLDSDKMFKYNTENQK